MYIVQAVLLLLIVLALSNAFQTYQKNIVSFKTNKISNDIKTLRNFKIVIFNKIEDDIDETTKKYGLEAGLLKAATSDKESSKNKASELLKKYGIAYLVTSITLAIISYTLCYFLIANGVDVSALLEKVGITATTATANAGTAGLAYCVHKAASPIRFPPTVALTPIVANWIGKKPAEDSKA